MYILDIQWLLRVEACLQPLFDNCVPRAPLFLLISLLIILFIFNYTRGYSFELSLQTILNKEIRTTVPNPVYT